MDYDKMTVESLAHDCFKRSEYAINKQDLMSRIEFLCEQYHQSKVNNVVLDGVIVCDNCTELNRKTCFLGVTCPKCNKPFRSIRS